VGCRKGDKDNTQRKARGGSDELISFISVLFSQLLLSFTSLSSLKARLSVQGSGTLLRTWVEQL